MSQPTAPGAPAEPATDAASPVAALEARLGRPFPDAALALAALTHKSYVNEHRGEPLADNERLEFLGDAVIDLAVSQRLMERFPGAREGDLSKMRAALVDETALARLGRELQLGPLLRLGRGEERTGGREKASLLADALEAVVAVIYLAGGLPAVLDLLDRFLDEAFARAAAGTLDRDYKTQLQEFAQGRFRTSPRYRVVAEIGPDHAKTFEIELEIRGEVVGRGTGRSKKDAEQAAAREGLRALAPEEEAADVPGPALPTPPGAGAGAEALARVGAEADAEAMPPADAEAPLPAAPEPDDGAAAPGRPRRRRQPRKTGRAKPGKARRRRAAPRRRGASVAGRPRRRPR